MKCPKCKKRVPRRYREAHKRWYHAKEIMAEAEKFGDHAQ